MTKPVAEPLIEVRRNGDSTTIYLRNCTSLDNSNVERIGDQLAQVAESNGNSTLRLNLGDVQFLSSLALGKLLSLNKKVRQQGGKLTLENPQPTVREIFSLTRLDNLIEVCDGKPSGK